MTKRPREQFVNVLIKIVIKKYKKEEFLDSMYMYLEEIRKQPGCLGYELYQDPDEKNTYLIVGEWKSAKAMENHFQSREYELSLGAAKVLCNSFEIETTEVLNVGNHDWARKQIGSKKNTGKTTSQ